MTRILLASRVGRTPSSAPDPLIRPVRATAKLADEGVGRGPGARPTIAVAVMVITAGIASAQMPVAPTNEQVGEPRGTNVSAYNIANSFEAGYRFRNVDGDLATYRSDVNYGNGLRLLASSLTVTSREGHGPFFDELSLTTQGLGNDPYESASLRIRRNRLYRYDLLWRLNDYVNAGLIGVPGPHPFNTTRTLQDHDLTLLPESSIRLFLGYSRNRQTGPALSTTSLSAQDNVFALFENVRRATDEYRLGFEARATGYRLNVLRGWQGFKEDTPFDSAANTGLFPDSGIAMSSFARREPYHGTSPYWRVALLRDGAARFGVNGRFTYTEGRRNFVFDETSLGSGRFGSQFNNQVVAFGNARRPVATGNLTLTAAPTDKLSFSNHTSIYHVRTEGDSTYREYDFATLSFESLNYQFLGIRTIANQSEIYYRATKGIGLFAGYNYTNRRIRSIAQLGFADDPANAIATRGEQTNELHAGTFGLRLRPLRPLTVIVDGEIGRQNAPIYPISDKDYHALRVRGLYKTRTLTISGYARTNYNFNSTSLTAYSSKARDYSANASWSPAGRFGFDASYSKLHLDTLGGIVYFVNFDAVTGDRSYYVSNIHTINGTARFTLAKFADLYVGYSRVQDRGDGRSTPTGAGLYTTLPALQAVQTFPLTFESPLARLSIRLNKRVRWNAGYQFYHYDERFQDVRNYRAHTGFTSILWSF